MIFFRKTALVCLMAGIGFGLAACGDGGEQAAAPSGGAGADTAVLAERVATLEQRKTRIEDSNAIKKLERAFGYYRDYALWDEAVELYADDATVEYGLDGVYKGKDRIREYYYALTGGKPGLEHGQLSQHMLIMPVVTIAEDGKTAKARWTDIIMAGEYGKSALWGLGPYENTYVKEDGVWKIKSTHWYELMMAPYEEGWAKAESPMKGIYASDELAPDAPPTEMYETWPATYLPEFSFENPVTGSNAASTPDLPEPNVDTDATVAELAQEAAVLQQEIQLLEDENEIENLQRIYGFYVDESLWSQVADLYTEDATMEIGGRGVYTGPESIKKYLMHRGGEYPVEGRLYEHTQMQPVIHVSPDGKTAKGRWRAFIQVGTWQVESRWGLAIYENEYRKEDGVWKISKLMGYFVMYSPYDQGWGKVALPNSTEEADLPPHDPPSIQYETYPTIFVPPFHYENPVTGDPVYAGTAADYAPAPVADAAALEAQLDALDHRVTLAEDADAIERLHSVYGYYLARNQWDELAAIFSPEGTIEIALRGRYVGAESIRRNLDLYGEQGIHHGLLHHHMQYQPVIHVAEDGQTAKMRSRAFSMMGQYGEYAQWMGGVYENTFVKNDGVWMLDVDRVFNTYFVSYDGGWANAVPRKAPGITESNPPDLPPSSDFEMFPKPFVVPFHYDNPVSGRKTVWPPQEAAAE